MQNASIRSPFDGDPFILPAGVFRFREPDFQLFNAPGASFVSPERSYDEIALSETSAKLTKMKTGATTKGEQTVDSGVSRLLGCPDAPANPL
jgi:hypothetical protein